MDNFKINERPAKIGYYPDAGENDCAINIQTDRGRVLDLTYADAQKLIERLNQALEGFNSFNQK